MSFNKNTIYFIGICILGLGYEFLKIILEGYFYFVIVIYILLLRVIAERFKD
jgi:hypothetical protein